MADCPVVLVHGLASSSEHGWRSTGWLDVLEDAGRAVVAVDLPGHGTARRSDDPADYPDAAAEVADAFSGLGRVDAVGFSMGAHLLVECAARGLASFNRLALLGVGPTLIAPRGSGADRLADALLKSDDTDIQGRLFRTMARSAGNDVTAVSAFLRRPARPTAADDLAAIACPVLVVTGERDPAGSAEELAAMMPDATGLTVRGADHFSIQSDVRAMDAVLSFLDV